MRTTLLFLALAALASCTKTVTFLKTGDPCTDDNQCSSLEICFHDHCTHNCVGQLDCAVGFDCGLQDPKDPSATCYKSTFDATSPGGFGENCAAGAMGCGGTD